jgi:hypothetical protein
VVTLDASKTLLTYLLAGLAAMQHVCIKSCYHMAADWREQATTAQNTILDASQPPSFTRARARA